MATLDQLPAEQRAIVELVVQRGRSYDALADVLQVPTDRVRELARDALSELSPRTGSRVDPDWRGQIADYLLGQQSAAQSSATRDYLRRSETGRAWALSLLDSLDPLYANGSQPAVPEPDEEEAAPTEPVAVAEPPAAVEAKEPDEPAATETVEERVRARRPERERRAEPERKAREPLRKPALEEDEEEEEARPARRARAGALSAEAQAALRRRRIRGAAAGLVVLAAIVVGILALAGAFSSDKAKRTTATTGGGGTSTTASGQQPIQVLGQIPLSPVGKVKAQGLAYIVQQGGQRFLVVQAQVPPLPSTQKAAAYEVWLYNSNSDARSLGAQYTNAQGILQGRANLPADFGKFKAIDISRELFDRNAAHGNNSVLRGLFASLQPVPQQQGTTTTPQSGTGTTP